MIHGDFRHRGISHFGSASYLDSILQADVHNWDLSLDVVILTFGAYLSRAPYPL